ncbi:MAG: hypothetical protein PHY45_17575 [Rhodocyclaceae bacterium]|nr:hypothetical protein [Rhodocyclaceae bacterium]
MKKLPPWVKALAVVVIFAALYGAAQLLLFLNNTSGGHAGLD